MEATRDRASSLEYGTKLGEPRKSYWAFVLYPEASEGGGSFRSASASPRGEPPAADPDRNAADAARRARGKVRRYCAANRLNRLGTLTYGPPFCRDPYQLRRDVAGFFRRLRSEASIPAFPYLWVPELHADRERFHVHFAVGRFVHYIPIRRAWPHGFVHITLLGDLPVGSGTLGEARKAAGYLAKYLGKDLGRADESGLHRYEVAQGFQPRAVTIAGRSADDVIEWAETYMGSPAERVWRSRDEEAWDGPPAVWASWS